jgi:hypothetical protein
MSPEDFAVLMLSTHDLPSSFGLPSDRVRLADYQSARFSLGPRYMKRLVILLITGIVLSQLGTATAASSENSATRDLAAAKSLAFGGVGVAGLMSEGERNLRAVLQQADASQQLQAAFAHATPAGKLYVLVGLRRCDRAAYQKVFDSLGRSSDDVEVVADA